MAFLPQYRITPKLLENIKRIAALVAGLNTRVLPKFVLAEFERRANELSAHSSTSIEGNPLPLIEVKRILKSRPTHLRDSEREVLNYNQALVRLNRLARQERARLDLGLIRSIQRTVTKGLIEPYRCGRIRREPVFVNNPRTRQPIYLPPDHQDVPTLMDDLLRFLREQRERTDPLIIAGIFHRQFVIIHPFVDGNGRTARLATKVLLAELGLNTFNLFSFENYYNRNVTRYFQQVGLLGNYYELKDQVDFTGWLEYFTDGIVDELLRMGKELEKAKAQVAPLLPSQQRLLVFLRGHGRIADRQYAQLTDRARPTRALDFNRLIKLGLIARRGRGRATYYVLAE